MSQIDFLGDPIFQPVDTNGVPIAGGLLWCYDAGTSNLRQMYATITDAINQANPIANPFTLDSSGSASIVYAGPSKFVLEGSEVNPITGHGPLIWTADNVGRFGNTVIDPNGNIIVDYEYLNNSVNYVKITNAPASVNPIIEFTGADTQVGGTIKVKGNAEGVTIKSDVGQYTLPPTDGAAGYVQVTDGAGNLTWQAQAGVSAILPSGIMLDYAGTSAPSGWLLCDGSAVSRATYSSLFSAIGTTWGSGDGVNTFNVPDFRRRVRVGSGGTASSILSNTVGSVGGAETVTITAAGLPAHNHTASVNTIADHQHGFAIGTSSGAVGAATTVVGGGSTTNTNLAGGHTHTVTVNNSTGGGGGTSVVQSSAIVLAIIKT